MLNNAKNEKYKEDIIGHFKKTIKKFSKKMTRQKRLTTKNKSKLTHKER